MYINIKVMKLLSKNMKKLEEKDLLHLQKV